MSVRLSPPSGRSPGEALPWKSERIPADDPYARFAAVAQEILVARMIAESRARWREYDEREAQRLQAKGLARHVRDAKNTARLAAAAAARDELRFQRATR